MLIDHEGILTPLFNTLAAVANFGDTGRRKKFWSKVTEFPALFLSHHADEDVYHGSILGQTTIEAEVWIYSNAGRNPDVAPSVALNGLIDAVRAVFLTPDNPMTRTFTLGGLVQWARIEGKTEIDPGDIDGIAKAILPVRILCP